MNDRSLPLPPDLPISPPSASPPVLAPAPGWPRRQQTELHDELHARPPLSVVANSVVSYWVHWEMDARQAAAAMQKLCEACGEPGPSEGARHHVLRTAAWALKFERHGEFVSWQMNRPLPEVVGAPPEAEFEDLLRHASASAKLPADFVASLSGPGSGQMLAATHILLLTADDLSVGICRRLLDALEESDHTPLIGAHISDGAGTMFTRLALGADGFTRFVILDHGLPPDQAARAVQRLCEIEAYRMLAMLGFPVAQAEASALVAEEASLQGIVDAMVKQEDTADDASALEALTSLAAEVEHTASRTRYRFSATRAYRAIVQDRVDGLREQRISGVRTLGGFLGRRFEPAMALCDSTDRRLTDVAERINRALSLARVRVEMKREASNQGLFKALVRRQKLQLRLQQTVEGLSVVAISYYALSLVGYLAKAASKMPWLDARDIGPEIIVGVAVLPTVGLVTWLVHRVKKGLDD
jgi:uncharacterized membrane-anchored protein